MFPIPPDPREPQLEIVPTDPVVTELEVENEFWEKHAETPIEEIVRGGTKKPKGPPN